MKNIGLWIRWIKGVPLYKKSIFSHNSNKNTSIPLRFHFRKNPWFSTNCFGNCEDVSKFYLILSFTFFMIFIQISHFLNESQRKNRFKRRLKWNFSSILKSLFKIKFKIRISLKNSFYGHKRDKIYWKHEIHFKKLFFFSISSEFSP